jgi:quercetin dioxygenase-like cupin family protein
MDKRRSIGGVLAPVLVTSFASANSVSATPDSGVDRQVLARSAVGPYETGPGPFKVDAADIQLTLNKATEIAVVHSSMAPGGTLGWHSHPDVVFVTVTEGTMTLYDASDPSCTPYVVTAGQAFVEPIGHVHIARNESDTDRVSWYATHIGVPSGVPTTTDETGPANCPF